jgi:hypothetical protein
MSDPFRKIEQRIERAGFKLVGVIAKAAVQPSQLLSVPCCRWYADDVLNDTPKQCVAG